jgi:hypothetical protein
MQEHCDNGTIKLISAALHQLSIATIKPKQPLTASGQNQSVHG